MNKFPSRGQKKTLLEPLLYCTSRTLNWHEYLWRENWTWAARSYFGLLPCRHEFQLKPANWHRWAAIHHLIGFPSALKYTGDDVSPQESTAPRRVRFYRVLWLPKPSLVFGARRFRPSESAMGFVPIPQGLYCKLHESDRPLLRTTCHYGLLEEIFQADPGYFLNEALEK